MKINNKFTKGKWSVDTLASDSYPDIVSEGYETVICEMTSNGQSNDEVQANAKLIAAAPELLDALTMLVEETEEFNHLDNKNRAMLAKAREKARAAITKATK